MTLSFACVIHCFFAPALIIFSYGLLSFSIESEIVHYFILFLAVPISSIALMIGYRNHNVLSFLIIGIVGLSVLILAVVLENFIGETGERAMTLVGSSLVAYSPLQKLCYLQEFRLRLPRKKLINLKLSNHCKMI